MNNSNINSKLLNVYSKKADMSNYLMPEEGAGGERPLPNWHRELKDYMERSISEGQFNAASAMPNPFQLGLGPRNFSFAWEGDDQLIDSAKRVGMHPAVYFAAQQRALSKISPEQRAKYQTRNYDVAAEGMGLRTPEQVAFASPEAVQGRIQARKTELTNQALGNRTPEQQAFADPAAVRERMVSRKPGPDGLPVPSYEEGNRPAISSGAGVAEGRQALNDLVARLLEREKARQQLQEGSDAAEAAGRDAESVFNDVLQQAENRDREVAEARTMGDEAVQRFEDDRDARDARAMGDEAVQRFEESRNTPQEASFLSKLLNPTGNQAADYGIYGGGGALLGGGLGALLSSKENRLRNALLFALLGGGLGVGGKYLADKYQQSA